MNKQRKAELTEAVKALKAALQAAKEDFYKAFEPIREEERIAVISKPSSLRAEEDAERLRAMYWVSVCIGDEIDELNELDNLVQVCGLDIK